MALNNVDEKDFVNHPKHYNAHKSGIECIDLVELLSFSLGSAVKYVWRMEEKFNPAEDVKKALWYLNRELSNDHNARFLAPLHALAMAQRFAETEKDANVAGIVLCATRAGCAVTRAEKQHFIEEAVHHAKLLTMSY